MPGHLIVPGNARLPHKEVRTFGTMAANLLEFTDWLAECQVKRVAMESTGVYGKPVVHHEALFDREGMKEPLLRTVAAVC
jgi:hypothetical protein